MIKELIENLIEEKAITVDEWDAFGMPEPLYSSKAVALITDCLLDSDAEFRWQMWSNAFEDQIAELDTYLERVRKFHGDINMRLLGEQVYQRTLDSIKNTVMEERLYDEIDKIEIQRMLGLRYQPEPTDELPEHEEYESATAHNRG